MDHYTKYGRSFFSRYVPFPSSASLTINSYDYEEVSSVSGAAVMSHLSSIFLDPAFVGKTLSSRTTSPIEHFTVASSDNFAYTDPIDHSVSTNQGLFVKFTDGSRVVFRLSGTGSSGATVRLYVERYTDDKSQYAREVQDALKGLIEVALDVSRLTELTGREKASVITVRPSSPTYRAALMDWRSKSISESKLDAIFSSSTVRS